MGEVCGDAARVNLPASSRYSPCGGGIGRGTCGHWSDGLGGFRNLLSELAGDRTVILSTKIVEDIAQTCRRLAVMAAGDVLFQGTAEGLVDAAHGRVWTLRTSGEKPEAGLTVVSTLHLGGSGQNRVVGEPSVGASAEPAEPSLEDGYVSLLQGRRRSAAAGE